MTLTALRDMTLTALCDMTLTALCDMLSRLRGPAPSPYTSTQARHILCRYLFYSYLPLTPSLSHSQFSITLLFLHLLPPSPSLTLPHLSSSNKLMMFFSHPAGHSMPGSEAAAKSAFFALGSLVSSVFGSKVPHPCCRYVHHLYLPLTPSTSLYLSLAPSNSLGRETGRGNSTHPYPHLSLTALIPLRYSSPSVLLPSSSSSFPLPPLSSPSSSVPLLPQVYQTLSGERQVTAITVCNWFGFILPALLTAHHYTGRGTATS